MSSTNRGAERAPFDFYPTPAWATKALLAACPDLPGGLWCEPAIGDGAIVRAVEEARPGRQTWIAADIRPEAVASLAGIEEARRGAVLIVDFTLGVQTLAGCAVYITNPPFILAEAFARECLKLAAPQGATVALLLRLAFLETATRAPFHVEHPADIYPFATRPSFVVDGKTDSTAYAWWVWGPGRGGRWHAPLLKPAGSRR